MGTQQRSYHVIAPWSFSRADGPWPQIRSKRSRRETTRKNSQKQEALLEEWGVFEWYRDRLKQKEDPRRKLKGEPHPFGAVPLVMTSVAVRDFRNRFPDALLLPRSFIRLPARARVLGAGKPSPEANDLWYLDEIGATLAHAKAVRGAGVTVALIDSGVDSGHAEFAGKNIRSRMFDPTSGVPLGLSDGDTVGHGTQMASLIAGLTTGVAPAADIIDVKVLRDGVATSDALLSALNWVLTDASANIVNMSWGFSSHKPALEPVINQLLAAGILTVCASGDSGPGTAACPGDFDAGLTVGSTARDGKVSSFSSSKEISNSGQSIRVPDLVAPGEDVGCARSGGGYDIGSGTSHSSALASGAAALFLEARGKSSTVHDLMATMILHCTALDPSDRAGKGLLRYGMPA
jgi:subtilisin family serine protease